MDSKRIESGFFDRNTRIICTMGPAVESVDKVRQLIKAGMNIARFNFSHGDQEYHRAAFQRVREASRLEGVPVALLMDTRGPEIRTGLIEDSGKIQLERDSLVSVIAQDDVPTGQSLFCTADRILVSYQGLADDIKPGAKILIADGLVSLEVLSVQERQMCCRVLDGGAFGSRKNVNIIGVSTKLPAMSDKDKEDLLLAIEENLDFIAASFIRKAADVTSIQRYLAEHGAAIPVISKIEDEEGLDNIKEIIRVSSGIMVARGDLGVQVPAERVPIEQKRIIKLCNEAGKPVITATQMLESMVTNPRPTRAEAGDVANAILDGTDCVMLSGETAAGQWPVEAVSVMARIARTVEASDEYTIRMREKSVEKDTQDISAVIAESAGWTADRIQASAIIVPTISGNTARLVSQFRPQRPIIAATISEAVQRRLLLYWGIVPLLVQMEQDSEAMIQGAIAAALNAGYVKLMDKAVVVAGLPVNSPLMANSIRVHVIGNVLSRGGKGFGGRCTGRLVKASSLDEASRILRKSGGEILVTHTLDESFIPILRVVNGVILEGVSAMPWEIIKKTNPLLVYVSQVTHAMEKLEDNLVVTLDGDGMLVYEGTV